MHAAGATVEQCAAHVGCSVTAMRAALRSDTARAVRATVLRDTVHAAKAVLAESAERAAQRLVELLDSERDDTALRATASVLDRVGVGVTTTTKHVHELSADELAAEFAEAVQRLRAAGELP